MKAFFLLSTLNNKYDWSTPKAKQSKGKHFYRPHSVVFYYFDINLAKTEINPTF
jgi:hypothetical protein